ncbi:H-type small acid-soluble spore protein [Paenibacillus shunpengii]|nr:small acid-soluble spore protein [Paenibacillus sp. TCA20]SDX30904.1 small acid-soluble spore protein H (minor) [Paenibacillus sp. PDC88]
MMDANRAKAIYEAKENISVKLDGEQPIWIEHVDVENQMATVQIGNNPLETHTVRVDRLVES